MIYIISLIVAGGVLALDLVTKSLAEAHAFNFVVIPELLKFELAYNTGAAFSFLGDFKWAIPLFIAFTIIVLLAIIAFFVVTLIKKRKPSKWFFIALSLAFSGALGNMIDRIAFSKVRDFIYLFYNTDIFPAIFNVADIALVVGLIMVVVYLLFLDKDAILKKPQGKDGDGNDKN
ncbi:MAG: signal peptidase II [Clostridia bacterium]|nr:signal peptidase II [Clostridia bacterium]